MNSLFLVTSLYFPGNPIGERRIRSGTLPTYRPSGQDRRCVDVVLPMRLDIVTVKAVAGIRTVESGPAVPRAVLRPTLPTFVHLDR